MKCPKCGSDFPVSDYCGTRVCIKCRHHGDFITRCYCGWAASGGDGRKELEEMGETIDPEPEIPGEWDDDCDPGPFPDSQPAYQEGEYPIAGITRRYL